MISSIFPVPKWQENPNKPPLDASPFFPFVSMCYPHKVPEATRFPTDFPSQTFIFLVCLPIFPWSSHDFAMKSGQHRRSWGNFSKQRRSRLLLFPGGEDTLLQDRKMAGKYYVYPIWLTSFNRELVLDSRPLDFGEPSFWTKPDQNWPMMAGILDA